MLAPARHRHGLDEGAFRLTRKDGSPGIDGGESAGGQPVGPSRARQVRPLSRVAGLPGVLPQGGAASRDDEAGCGLRTEALALLPWLPPGPLEVLTTRSARLSTRLLCRAVWSLDSRHERRRSYKCRRSGVAAGWKRVRWFVCSRPRDCKSYRKASSRGGHNDRAQPHLGRSLAKSPVSKIDGVLDRPDCSPEIRATLLTSAATLAINAEISASFCPYNIRKPTARRPRFNL